MKHFILGLLTACALLAQGPILPVVPGGSGGSGAVDSVTVGTGMTGGGDGAVNIGLDTSYLNTNYFNRANVTLGSDATGDVYYRAAGGALVRLGIGTNDQIMRVVSGLPAWFSLTSLQIPYSSTTGLVSTNVRAALDELNTAKQATNTLLTAIAGLGTGGIVARLTASTAAARTLTGTTDEITITNGDGVSGNPTFALSSTVNLGSKILRIPNSTTLPATCAVGNIYMDTDATSGQRLYLCQSTNTWALQGDGGSGGGSAGAAAGTFTSETEFTITHSLNSEDVDVVLYNSNDTRIPESDYQVDIIDADSVFVTFANAIAQSGRWIVHGGASGGGGGASLDVVVNGGTTRTPTTLLINDGTNTSCAESWNAGTGELTVTCNAVGPITINVHNQSATTLVAATNTLITGSQVAIPFISAGQCADVRIVTQATGSTAKTYILAWGGVNHTLAAGTSSAAVLTTTICNKDSVQNNQTLTSGPNLVGATGQAAYHAEPTIDSSTSQNIELYVLCAAAESVALRHLRVVYQ